MQTCHLYSADPSSAVPMAGKIMYPSSLWVIPPVGAYLVDSNAVLCATNIQIISFHTRSKCTGYYALQTPQFIAAFSTKV